MIHFLRSLDVLSLLEEIDVLPLEFDVLPLGYLFPPVRKDAGFRRLIHFLRQVDVLTYASCHSEVDEVLSFVGMPFLRLILMSLHKSMSGKLLVLYQFSGELCSFNHVRNGPRSVWPEPVNR